MPSHAEVLQAISLRIGTVRPQQNALAAICSSTTRNSGQGFVSRSVVALPVTVYAVLHLKSFPTIVIAASKVGDESFFVERQSVDAVLEDPACPVFLPPGCRCYCVFCESHESIVAEPLAK